jgi:hypothetical protein
MRTNTKRSLGFLCLLVLLFVASVSPVAADGKPIGDCPPGFTFKLVSELNLGGASGIASLDGNGDGWTCMKRLDTPPYPTAVILVDNRVMKP